ncbi:style cell-cycle inhibitor 1-B isoform X2 [Arachis stenosperma]|uniref:style cell-cycle inhibitor 1-B isoform X2 n=1 Tax=Arachis stenosperma TaxID=217475 RepID=UPI0025ABF61C|nr:style cell-cycle inhibitor 1-B isoform X2 [Arachis stenosperma]
MGSDRKCKRHSYSSPSDSEDERKSKRQRTVEDEEKKKRRKLEKKEKRKDKKSHKHSKEKSDKDKKSKETYKSKRSKGDIPKGIQELSSDDYFAKNNEFATWLKEEKNVFFSDLSSESAREMFSDFVKAWNKGKLETNYYEGIASGPRTAHNWKIKK